MSGYRYISRIRVCIRTKRERTADRDSQRCPELSWIWLDFFICDPCYARYILSRKIIRYHPCQMCEMCVIFGRLEECMYKYNRRAQIVISSLYAYV